MAHSAQAAIPAFHRLGGFGNMAFHDFGGGEGPGSGCQLMRSWVKPSAWLTDVLTWQAEVEG